MKQRAELFNKHKEGESLPKAQCDNEYKFLKS